MRIVLGISPIGTLVRRHPCRKRGQRFIRRAQLPQDDADIRAREAIVGDGDSGRIRSGCDRCDDTLLERNRFGITEQPQHILKRLVATQVECSRVTGPVFQGMRRIEVSARNPTDGNGLRR